MRKEQLLTICVALALVLVLYFFGKTKDTAPKESALVEQQHTFSDYELLKLEEIPEMDAKVIQDLKAKLVLQADAETTLALSKAWENIGNYPLGAYYYYKSTELNTDSADWTLAGEKLYNSYKNYADTLVTNNLLTFALASLKKAAETDIGNTDLKMKLAEVYVESPEPMKGILMLREIVDSIPDYIPAIMSLGRLSLQTGQYDKAVSRFHQVLEINSVDTEALYFLALANEGLGNIDETIKLLETCKNLVQIPEFSKEIDAYINNLKK